jgi:hypothetical protein
MAFASAACRLLPLPQAQVEGRLTEAIELLHNNLKFLAKERDRHLSLRPAGKASPFDEFFDDGLLQVFGNACGTEADVGCLVKHSQLLALAFEANGGHTRLDGLLQNSDAFVKGFVIGHANISSIMPALSA